MKFPALTLSGSLACRRRSTSGSSSGMGLGKSRGRQLPHVLPLVCPWAGTAALTPGWVLRAQDLRTEPPPSSSWLQAPSVSEGLRSPQKF